MTTSKGTPSAEAKAVTAGPVNPLPNKQERVEPEALLVTDTEPQVGDDGKVYVSDAISDAAVAEGYAPDIQPKHHVDDVALTPAQLELAEAQLKAQKKA